MALNKHTKITQALLIFLAIVLALPWLILAFYQIDNARELHNCRDEIQALQRVCDDIDGERLLRGVIFFPFVAWVFPLLSSAIFIMALGNRHKKITQFAVILGWAAAAIVIGVSLYGYFFI